MTPLMFGVESEYAIAGMKGREPLNREDLVNRFVRTAQRRLAHLPDTSGMFLENGARFYVDCGLHPEMTTPECTTPWELARYIKAGERILEGLAQAVQAETGAATEVMCFRCNVDYSGSRSTWGCHESYLHRANPASLPDQLIPHLVTRVIYTGAGGFHPMANLLQFCVAPRLMHIRQVISGASTNDRGIFHTKNEPLAGGGYNRLHILCGESLCSETAIVLKIGTTALVTAMAARGLRPGAELALASPLEALHTVASDVTCKQRLPLAAGGEATAIEIQRRLLQLAERHRRVLPPWADAICALWRRTLEQLEGAPDSVATVLDWAIKHRLFHDRAARLGIPEERFEFLNSLVLRLNAALAGAGVNAREFAVSAALGPSSIIPEQAAQVVAALAAKGLAADDLARFVGIRNEFYEIDTRFGQIGPRGIFTELDRCGVLDHKVPGIGGVEAAMREPPAVGRAILRGDAVRQLSGQERARCTWDAVVGPDGRTLNLSDPFANTASWNAAPAPPHCSHPPDISNQMEAARDRIARRAYELWQERGRPLGSPEVDWFQAVREFRENLPAAENIPLGDSSFLSQMLSAVRRRHGRSRTGAQSPAEPTARPNR